MMDTYPGRLGIVQRVLPRYRAPLFDCLATRCRGGMTVFAGQQASWEALATVDRLGAAGLQQARNRHLLRGSFAACWQAGLVAWLERWDPDILVVEANPRCVSTGRAVRWMHARGRPVLGWGLGVPEHQSAAGAPWRVVWARFVQMFDGVLAYSSRGAEQYRAAGVPADRVFVCKNAAAFRPSDPPPRRPPSFSGRPVILFVGRLVAAKRIDDLICAGASVERADPKLAPELHIVGAGPAREGLEELAHSIYPQAKLLGPLYGKALEDEFARADLFVLPGPGGLAVQEAMSHGLPVIVGQGDGTQDDLVRPENGWQVPLADSERLATTMRTALADAPKLRMMGAASFDIVAREVNVERLVDSFIHALNARSSKLAGEPSYR